MRRITLVILLLLSWPSLVLAQTDRASVLKREGDEQMRALHFKEALEKYDEALKAGGSAAIHYNRARTLEALGDYPLALDALEEFIRNAPIELRSRVPKLDDLLADLRAHVGTLVVSTPVTGATVRIGHKFAGTTPLAQPLRVSVGDLLVEVEAPGYKPFSQHVRVVTGESHVDAALEKEETQPAPTPTPTIITTATPVAESPVTGNNLFHTAAYVVGGTGVALLAAGAVFGGVAALDRGVLDQDCPNKVCDVTGLQVKSEAWAYATLSTIGLIAGPVLIAGAVVLFFASPKGSKHVAAGPRFLGLSGTF